MSMSYGPGRYDRALRGSTASTTRSPTCAGPRTATCRPSSRWSRAGSVRPAALDTEIVAVRGRRSGLRGPRAAATRRSLAAIFRYARGAVARARAARWRAPRRRPRARASASPSSAPATTRRPCCCRRSRPRAEARRVQLVTATGASARRSAEKFGFAICGTDPDAGVRRPRGRPRLRSPRATTATPRSRAARCAPARPSGWRSRSGSTPERGRARCSRPRARPAASSPSATTAASRRTRARSRAAFAARSGPLAIHYAVAAGPPPRGTWILDPARRRRPHRRRGLPLRRPLHATWSARRPTSVFARAPRPRPAGRRLDGGDARLRRRLDRDASSTWPTRSAELPKERFEVSADGRTARCDNFRATKRSGAPDVKTLNQDKGQATAVAEVIEAVRAGRPSPFSLGELAAVSQATFAMLESARTGPRCRRPGRGPRRLMAEGAPTDRAGRGCST